MEAIGPKTQTRKRPSREEAAAAVRILLAFAGDDPERAGLLDTPHRVIRAYEELFAGYTENAHDALSRTFEEVSGYDDFILIRDITFVSHCEHHMMPFTGSAHIAYWPTKRIAGLSKVARLVQVYARRLQNQETMTAQIAQGLITVLEPKGVAVMVEAEHQCMSLRGVRQLNARTLTTHYSGCFKERAAQRRFGDLVARKS